MYKKLYLFALAISAFFYLPGCKSDDVTPPDNGNPGNLVLSYGDSILYLRNQSGDYIVNPQPLGKAGRFSAYPDGLDINSTTGAINLNQSETGLRYKIMFTPDGTNDVISTKVVLSGINYKDYYHVQAQNDSLSRPFYNANFNNYGVPCSGNCVFDEGGSARAEGLAIDPVTGVINLNQTIRNGFFRSGPPNDGDKKEVMVSYRLQDGSNRALNKISVKLYFYDRMATVETELLQLLQERTDMFFRMSQGIFEPLSSATSRAASRPRPPCVIILRQQ
jgi:hypothetical protein